MGRGERRRLPLNCPTLSGVVEQAHEDRWARDFGCGARPVRGPVPGG